jgi:hypothetical protein
VRFVIDLNVIRPAWSGMDPTGVPAPHSAILILQLVNKGHQFAVTKEIAQRYQRLFDELKRPSLQGPSALNVVRLYFTAKQMGNVDNSRCSADLPPLPEESHIKDEDRDFARLANLIRAVLVTYDEPLITELANVGVTAVKPEAAVKLADP